MRDAVIYVRVTPAERRAIAQAADARGLGIAGFVRSLLLDATGGFYAQKRERRDGANAAALTGTGPRARGRRPRTHEQSSTRSGRP